MPKIAGKQLPFPIPVRLATNVLSNGLGKTTEIAFEQAPNEFEGQELGVASLLVTVPGMDITVPTGTKVLDRVSMLSMLAQLSLRLSTDSPYAKSDDGHIIIDAVDGYRALMALEFMAGRKAFAGYGQAPVYGDPSKLGNVSATAIKDALVGTHGDEVILNIDDLYCDGSWPQLSSWFGFNGTVGSVDWQDAPVFEIPLLPYGGDIHRDCIPLRHFTGRASGCAQMNSGRLAVQLCTTTGIDGYTVAQSGTFNTFDVIAMCYTRDPNATEFIPAVPFVRQNVVTGSQFRLSRGSHKLTGFFKPLDANGNQSTHDYTTVDVRAKGSQMIPSDMVLHMLGLSHRARRSGYRVVSVPQTYTGKSQSTLVNFNNAVLRSGAPKRYSNPGVPLLFNDAPFGEYDLAADCQIDVNVGSSGETTHNVLEAGHRLVSKATLDAAVKFAGAQGTAAVASRQNPAKTADGVNMALHGGAVLRPRTRR